MCLTLLGPRASRAPHSPHGRAVRSPRRGAPSALSLKEPENPGTSQCAQNLTRAKRIALAGATHREFHDTLCHPLGRFPLHYEPTRVHAVISNHILELA